MEILNDRANPPILVKCTPSKSTSRLGKIVYLDPEDRLKFNPSDLTNLEMGKVLQWSRGPSGRVNLHLPLRIMGRQLAGLLKGLTSYRSEDPTTLSFVPTALRRKVSVCLQDFSLGEADWKVLQERVVSWEVEKYSINTEQVFFSISKTKELILEVLSVVKDLRQTCSPGNKEVLSQENLSEILKLIETTQETIEKVKEERARMLPVLDKVHLLSSSVRVRLLGELEVLDGSVEALNKLDFSRLEREALHKHRLSQGDPVAPTHMRTLSEELEDLKVYYPSLKVLKAEGENVVLSLAGVDIILQKDSVIVRGDLANLAKFTEKSISVSKKGGRNRFRAVLRELD